MRVVIGLGKDFWSGCLRSGLFILRGRSVHYLMIQVYIRGVIEMITHGFGGNK